MSIVYYSAWHTVTVQTFSCCLLSCSFQLEHGKHNAHPTHLRIIESDEIMYVEGIDLKCKAFGSCQDH